MAVLNGERMHDTMERLLPGARSAALLWQRKQTVTIT